LSALSAGRAGSARRALRPAPGSARPFGVHGRTRSAAVMPRTFLETF